MLVGSEDGGRIRLADLHVRHALDLDRLDRHGIAAAALGQQCPRLAHIRGVVPAPPFDEDRLRNLPGVVQNLSPDGEDAVDQAGRKRCALTSTTSPSAGGADSEGMDGGA